MNTRLADLEHFETSLDACLSLAWAIKDLGRHHAPDSPIVGVSDHLWDLLARLQHDVRQAKDPVTAASEVGP